MELAALLVNDGHSDPPLDALGNEARSSLAGQPIVSSGLLFLDCVVWEWAGKRCEERGEMLSSYSEQRDTGQGLRESQVLRRL